jgi:quercetin dioxygenase-like cupin family protein
MTLRGEEHDMTPPIPIIRARGEGDRRVFFGGGLHTWKLLAEETDGAFFLFEDTLAQGKTTPLHQHPEADETIYVLDGELAVDVAGQRSRVGAGGVSFVPRGVPHALLVVSDGARLLTWQTPGTGQAFYRGASEPATGDVSDVVDIARVQASAKENGGVQILGPPPFDTHDGSERAPTGAPGAGTAARVKQVFGAVVAIGLLAAASAVFALPAGARVPAKNAKFCQILSSDQGADIDFDGLGTAEAKYAAKLIRKLAKTGVPATLKSDLGKLAKVYDRVAGGASPEAVLAGEQKAIAKSLMSFTAYVSANCSPSAPSGS